MSDLIKRLRKPPRILPQHLLDEAADELKRQDAVIARLGEHKYMYVPNEIRPRHLEPDWKMELEAYTQYALDNRSKK